MEKISSQPQSSEKLYQLALSMLPHVGGTLAKQLISYCGSAEQIFTASSRQLSRIPGIGDKIISGIRKADALFSEAEAQLQACEKQGVSIITYEDEAYPARLRQIFDAPILLFFKGNADLSASRMISMVGTREATPYGRQVVEELVNSLLPYNVTIVSGLAYGIDIFAHRASLQAGLPTIGVMGSGIDIIYPSVHRKEAWQMIDKGGLLTENCLGTKPDARRFPARNRIIAGLTDATVVVEAADKGGALITANLANDYDREVFAVPGSLYQPYSRGCNRLIREHKAHILTGVEDLINLMNWDTAALDRKEAAQVAMKRPELDAEEQKVVDLLSKSKEAMQLDILSWHAQFSVSKLAAILLSLEFKGLIRSLPGKKYTLV
ncbi:MAG: DNA-processing protein DprA [Cyclobacteriaceae bacterium]